MGLVKEKENTILQKGMLNQTDQQNRSLLSAENPVILVGGGTVLSPHDGVASAKALAGTAARISMLS